MSLAHIHGRICTVPLILLVMNKIQETLSKMAKDLHSVGAIDKTTLIRLVASLKNNQLVR
jgi:hypothetical protein